MENTYKFEDYELWNIVIGTHTTNYEIEIVSLIIS